MGLLDGLGSGGGLLDFLRQNALNQQMVGGLASDQAQYAPMQAPMTRTAQPSPLDTAQWPFGPMGAPSQEAALPQNAQPTQGQMPVQQPQQASPAFGDSYLDRVNAGGGLIRSLFGNSAKQQQQQQLFDAYKNAGLSPSQAYIAVLNPNLANNFVGSGQTDDIKEYNFAKKENPGLTFEKFMSQKKSVSGEYGLQGIWGVKNGKPAIMQLGKGGTAIESKLPEGFEPAQKPIEIDAGTHKVLIDPQTRQQIATIPKNVAAKEAEEKVGQARGTAQAALANGADIDAEATKKKIDELMSNEGFSSIFGSLDQYRPAWTLDASGKDARTRFEQLKGTAFLSAYAMLKGGGAITDIEGQKAGAAMARLDRSLSEDEAKQALRDFKDAVDMGLQKLRRAAGGGTAPAAPTGGSSVDDLLKKYGGK